MSTQRTEYRIVSDQRYNLTDPGTFRDDTPTWATHLAQCESYLQRLGVPYRVEWRTVIELLGEWRPRIPNYLNESQGRIQDGHAADDWANREH